jgi:hypothetical protein
MQKKSSSKKWQVSPKSWAYTAAAAADGDSAARGIGHLDIHYYTPVRGGASSSRSCRLDKFVLSTDTVDQMILLLLLLLRLIVLALPAVNDDDDGETEREKKKKKKKKQQLR